MKERDKMLAVRKDEIRDGIAKGMDSLRRGQCVDGDAVFDRIDEELAAINEGMEQIQRGEGISREKAKDQLLKKHGF